MIAELEARRDEIAELCRRYQVRRLEIFGSAATGAYRPGESDLDFLVEFEPPLLPGYADRYFGMKESLEALFGVAVDLVDDTAIKNRFFRKAVDESRAPLYAA